MTTTTQGTHGLGFGVTMIQGTPSPGFWGSTSPPLDALPRFIPRHEDELELDVDDPILVELEEDDYWYRGYNMRTGERGIFPAFYAHEVVGQARDSIGATPGTPGRGEGAVVTRDPRGFGEGALWVFSFFSSLRPELMLGRCGFFSVWALLFDTLFFRFFGCVVKNI